MREARLAEIKMLKITELFRDGRELEPKALHFKLLSLYLIHLWLG